MSNLTEEVVALRRELSEAREQQADADKEQEDVSFLVQIDRWAPLIVSLYRQLLVLLEDVSSKRKGDKARMRAEGLEVSEDEEEDEEEDVDGGEELV